MGDSDSDDDFQSADEGDDEIAQMLFGQKSPTTNEHNQSVKDNQSEEVVQTVEIQDEENNDESLKNGNSSLEEVNGDKQSLSSSADLQTSYGEIHDKLNVVNAESELHDGNDKLSPIIQEVSLTQNDFNKKDDLLHTDCEETTQIPQEFTTNDEMLSKDNGTSEELNNGKYVQLNADDTSKTINKEVICTSNRLDAFDDTFKKEDSNLINPKVVKTVKLDEEEEVISSNIDSMTIEESEKGVDFSESLDRENITESGDDVKSDDKEIKPSNETIEVGNGCVQQSIELTPPGNESCDDGTSLKPTKQSDLTGNLSDNNKESVSTKEELFSWSEKEESSSGWDDWADDFIQETASKVSSLIHTVEDKLGIPDPGELAQKVNDEDTVTGDYSKDNSTSLDQPTATNTDYSFSWFSPLSNLVQATGQDLVTGGIGALEFIGKKTVDILSDGDPGLRNTRKSLGKPNQTLSMALQEAKSRSDMTERCDEDPVVLNEVLEKHQCFAHLDALKMISNECENKLNRILEFQSEDAKGDSIEILVSVKKIYQSEKNASDLSDFKSQVFLLNKKLKLKVTCSKLLNSWLKLKDKEIEQDNLVEYFKQVLAVLAELTSRFIEYFRKIADMLMVTDVNAKLMVEERAGVVKGLSRLFIAELSNLSNRFAENLGDANTSVISDIYLEASNCTSLIQDADNLLLPILQCSSII